jgi:hypothetical protein
LAYRYCYRCFFIICIFRPQKVLSEQNKISGYRFFRPLKTEKNYIIIVQRLKNTLLRVQIACMVLSHSVHVEIHVAYRNHTRECLYGTFACQNQTKRVEITLVHVEILYSVLNDHS